MFATLGSHTWSSFVAILTAFSFSILYKLQFYRTNAAGINLFIEKMFDFEYIFIRYKEATGALNEM